MSNSQSNWNIILICFINYFFKFYWHDSHNNLLILITTLYIRGNPNSLSLPRIELNKQHIFTWIKVTKLIDERDVCYRRLNLWDLFYTSSIKKVNNHVYMFAGSYLIFVINTIIKLFNKSKSKYFFYHWCSWQFVDCRTLIVNLAKDTLNNKDCRTVQGYCLLVCMGVKGKYPNFEVGLKCILMVVLYLLLCSYLNENRM